MNARKKGLVTRGNFAYCILALIGITLIVLGIIPYVMLNPLFGVAVTLLALMGYVGHKRQNDRPPKTRGRSDR